jgi:hypothetical protein
MAATAKSLKSGYVPMVGPDDELDLYGSGWRPANALPVRCKHCSFPDIDFAPKPYLLSRGFSSPAESWSALGGNFLVRERMRKILELAIPKACDFHPTAELKSKKPTPWFLAVPKQKVTVGGKPSEREKCPKCGEPKTGYDFYDKDRNYNALDKCDAKGADIFKTVEWSGNQIVEDRFAEINKYRTQSKTPLMEWSESYGYLDPPTHKERWTRQHIGRELMFSVRLAQLLKAAKVKGQLVVYYYFKDFKPTDADLAWVDERLALLAKNKLVDAAALGKKAVGKAGKASKSATDKKSDAATDKWFKEYVKKSAKKKPAAVEFESIEKKHKLKLPKSYKDFIKTLGSKSFKDVNDMDGSTTKVLSPKQLEFTDYRLGALEDTDEDSAAVDGVMFATIDSGDCFVFDVSGKTADPPVFFYNHEINAMEPWSNNFAACIKRFAEKN